MLTTRSLEYLLGNRAMRTWEDVAIEFFIVLFGGLIAAQAKCHLVPLYRKEERHLSGWNQLTQKQSRCTNSATGKWKNVCFRFYKRNCPFRMCVCTSVCVNMHPHVNMFLSVPSCAMNRDSCNVHFIPVGGRYRMRIWEPVLIVISCDATFHSLALSGD